VSSTYNVDDFLDDEEQRELDRALGMVYGRPAEKFCISYVGQGQNYHIFRAEAGDQTLCIRFGHAGKEESIFGLKKALSICEKNNIVTNMVLFFDFACCKIHRPYMITTYIRGSTYDLSELSETEICRYFSDFGEYLARLHSIKYPFFLKELSTESRLDIREYMFRRYLKLYEGLKQCETSSIDLIGLDKIYQTLYNAIDFESIVPRFVHRDISATNMIMNNGKFQCLIDFEHAIFFDGVWDFVKLELNILSKIKRVYRECFQKSYQSILPSEQEKNSSQRFRLYYMLELMWAIVNDYNASRKLYLDILRDFVEKER
jgi:hypothetical protein